VSAPGLLVAAPRSSSGKTTVTLALMRALTRRGLRIRGAKCGPDYIDPAFHQAATGHPSFNLDSFAMATPLLDTLAGETAAAADVVIAEGSMGLFDGVRAAENRTGANADIAARYGWPVVLVVDVSGAAQSAAAVALGCTLYDPRVRIAGVILNKVASDRHRRLVEAGMERAGLPVLGALMRDAQLVLPERHLGLVQAGETADLTARLDRLADLAEAGIDLDAVLASAGGAVPASGGRLPRPPGQRVAVARDAAFSFLYPHLATGWRLAGAELVPFSPLADEGPPEDCDVCWLPGAIPNCMRAESPAPSVSWTGFATSPGHAPSTESAAATWSSGRRFRTPTAPPIPWRASSRWRHPITAASCISAIASRGSADPACSEKTGRASSATSSTMPPSSRRSHRRHQRSPAFRMRRVWTWGLPDIGSAPSPAASSI
jgi:cobyrinic acid a,c-diamide synthase